MSDKVRSIYEAASRMDIFGDANAGAISGLAAAAGMFAELKTVRQGLEAAGAARSSFDSAGASGTQSKAAVYNSICRRLRQISKTAAAIKRREPAFENKYILPRERMPYQDGIERAKAIYEDSAADRAKFGEYGMKPTFRDDLSADIAAFESAGQEQTGAMTSSVGETANLDSLVERFMDIHQPLNQIMKNVFADDPEKLAEWRTAAHIERKKPRTAPPPAAPPTP